MASTRLLSFCVLFALSVAQSLTAQACELLGLGIDLPSSPTTMKLWDVSKLTGACSNPRVISTGSNRAPTTIAFATNGTLYGVSQGMTSDVPAGGKLFTINATTGAATYVADLTILLTVEGDIAIDLTDDTLYAVTGVGDLFTIHKTPGVCTLIGNLPQDQSGGSDYSGLAFDSAGELWVWSTFGPIVRHIDKSNAAVLSTASLVPSPGGSIGGMAFDPSNGTAFLAAGTGASAKLMTCNLTTGAVTTVGPLAGMNGVYAIEPDLRECATVVTTGSGCTTSFASFYELLSASAQDLAGKIVTATQTSSGYTITTQNGSGVTVPFGATWLPLGNDDSVNVGTLGLYVGSNGWLARGPGNSTAPWPTVATLLNQPSEQISAWTDLDPLDPASGGVYYDEPAFGIGRATWYAVVGFGTYDHNSIQITWNVFTGDFTIEYGVLSPNNLVPWLTGYSPGGANLDPGPTDISTFGSNPHTITFFAVSPLTLTPIGRPVQGFTATTFDATTSNIEPTALLHLGFIGLQNPNLPLTIFGLPADCVLRTSIDVLADSFLFPGPTRTWTAINLPALPPSFSGFEFYAQSITFDNNGLGPTTRVSSGLRGKVGLH